MKLAKITGALAAAALLFTVPVTHAAPTTNPAPGAHAAPATHAAHTAHAAHAAPAQNAESAGVVDTEHKPGAPGYGDIVPANLRVPAGTAGAEATATPDADGTVPHVCAGRKLLHHAHVDAAYVTRVDGRFTTTVVDGQAVVKDPNTVCVRLAPDARSSDGLEVSRFVVPSAWQYEFLGKPGDIIWRAPQELYDNWRPVWAGIGAFDANHEVAVPDDILLDAISLRMDKAAGPGTVEIWRTTGMSNVDRGLSSANPASSLRLAAGAHGHWNWAFTEAGVYDLAFSASYTDKSTGLLVTSAPSAIRWLVGSDEEVGLPQGTTTGLSTIQISAEEQRARMIEAGEIDAEGGEPGEEGGADTGPRPLTDEEARAQITDLVGRWLPNPTATPQDFVFQPYFNEENEGDEPYQQIEVNLLDSTGQTHVKPVLEIPDSLRQDTADGSQWVLPVSSQHASLVFDFAQVPAETRSEPIVLDVGTFSGPERGRYIGSAATDGELVPRLDTVSRDSRKTVVDADQLDFQHAFTLPGLYKVEYSVQTKHANGQPSYKFIEVYFAVGDSTIAAIRDMKGLDPVDPAPAPEPQPGGSGEPGGLAEPGTPASPAEPSPTEPAPTEPAPTEPAPTEENYRYVINEGHMDQALEYRGGELVAFVDNTADPRNPLRHGSGTFAYTVPDSTRVKIPADARGYEHLRAAAPDGVWELPETQKEGLPWVGFSTMHVDYSLLEEPGVTVELRNVAGPGRFVSGQSTMLDGFVTRLDSEQGDLAITYQYPSHDHQAMYFTAPGRYTMDFVFTLHLKGGEKKEVPLSAMFLVGDETITAGPSGSSGDANSSGPGVGTDPGMSTDPSPDPGTELDPGTEPDPGVGSAPSPGVEPEPSPGASGSDIGQPGGNDTGSEVGSVKLSIDDLVDRLNAEARGKVWLGAATPAVPAR